MIFFLQLINDKNIDSQSESTWVRAFKETDEITEVCSYNNIMVWVL